jgi:hypothetical protein
MAVPAAGRAQSTDYPNQSISIVVGFAVGGFAEPYIQRENIRRYAGGALSWE